MKFLAITEGDNLMVLAQDGKALQAKIIEYIKFMKDHKKISTVTINLYLCSSMHFYSMNDVTLSRKRISRYVPERLKRHVKSIYHTRNCKTFKILRLTESSGRLTVCIHRNEDRRSTAIKIKPLDENPKILALSDNGIRRLR